MIGALFSIPNLHFSRLVNDRLRARGFHGVTGSNSVVLKVLAPEGERITEVARKAGITKQSMGYLVEQLEAGGIVERVPDPSDGRAQIVRRTEKGWAYNRSAAEEVARLEEEQARLLGPEKFEALKALLTELVEKLGYQYEGSSAEAALRR
jgi:DNA-binding MarR family transcriptional regulator